MINEIKQIFETGTHSASYFLYCLGRDRSYVYCIDRDRKIIFTSTDTHIRMNKNIGQEGLEELLKETAGKLNRKFIKADYPDNYLRDKQIIDCNANWNIRNLIPALLSNRESSSQTESSLNLEPGNVIQVLSDRLGQAQIAIADEIFNSSIFTPYPMPYFSDADEDVDW